MPERRPRVWVMTFTRFVPVGPYVASIARRMSSATETLDRFASAERNSYWLGLSTSWNRCDKVLEVYTPLASVFATKLARNWRERASRRPRVCGRRRSCTSTPLYSYRYAAVQLPLRRCTATATPLYSYARGLQWSGRRARRRPRRPPGTQRYQAAARA